MPLSDVTNTTGTTVVPSAKLRPNRHHHASNATTTATKLTDMFATTKDALESCGDDDFFTSCAKDEAVHHANNSKGTTPHPTRARFCVGRFSLSLAFRARARERLLFWKCLSNCFVPPLFLSLLFEKQRTSGETDWWNEHGAGETSESTEKSRRQRRRLGKLGLLFFHSQCCYFYLRTEEDECSPGE